MIDWENLLDRIGVEWRKEGKNTSRKDINICCPFCADDTSFHLGISLVNKNAYYCFRYPSEHSGRSVPRLLKQLGVPSDDVDTLIYDYDTDKEREPPPPPKLSDVRKRWNKFHPLAESAQCIKYLAEKRLFGKDTVAIATQYDLRYAPVGAWAKRVLFPIKMDGIFASWSGRGIRSSMVPKYKMQSIAHPGLLYSPKVAAQFTYIVEGPMDALKISAADARCNGVALLGKGVNASKLVSMRPLLAKSRSIFFVPDADVTLPGRLKMLAELRQIIRPNQSLYIKALPAEYKDVGQMPLEDVMEWLQ